MHKKYIWFNGEFRASQGVERSINLEDRGMQFGDGVYEVVRIYNGEYYGLEEHLERLYRSLDKVHISIPWDLKTLDVMMHGLVKKNEFSGNGNLYFQVTRGASPRNHIFPEGNAYTAYAYLIDAERPVEKLKNGVKVLPMEDIRWLMCDVKSLNLLGSVLAKQKAHEVGCHEALLYRKTDKGNFFTECSSSNAFFVKGDTIFTHPANNLILNGIVRRKVEDLSYGAFRFVERAVSVEELETFDEMFLTSTTSEIMPIVEVIGTRFEKKEPGYVTRKLQELYEADAKLK